MEIRITSDPIDPAAELAALSGVHKAAGAVVSFCGQVRSDESAPITTLEIEHYPGMTETAIAAIVAEAEARWDLLAGRVIHRHGQLSPGETIVFVATVAAHRHAALHAADFIMDYLKTRAPFWKKEHGPEGGHWVGSRTEDEAAARRWSDDS
ncbi:MAG: molybdenum cofactor biosynthesis protein MoaE [Rhodobacteraceae bacterium]|nr:molybdenum cofactor biosynthesis protein MoaE [Paracoccaceae bacterium]